MTGVGFAPTHTIVYQNSHLRETLESGALDRSAILPCTNNCRKVKMGINSFFYSISKKCNRSGIETHILDRGLKFLNF